MEKLKLPLLAALAAAGLAFAGFYAWKTFFNPYVAPPPVESGVPEKSGASR